MCNAPNSAQPPPVIGNARVLEYAMVGDAVFTGTLCLYVDEARLGAVPCLAICQSFDGNELFLRRARHSGMEEG
jgi:hypothetical protein